MDHEPSRRRLLQATGLALTTSLAGCNGGGGDGDDGGSNAAATVAVGPDSNRFDPEEVTVATGATVRWEWESDTHTVTPESVPDGADWAGEPEIHDEGHTYSHTFDVAGTYEYYCEPHRAAGMVGTVVVEE